MSAIKKFFEKTKLEMKFKKAGEGRKLKDSHLTRKEQEKPKQNEAKVSAEFTDERKRAAEAAMARVTQTKEKPTPRYSSSIKSQVNAEKREMEEAMAQARIYSSSSRQVLVKASPVISGVYFKCSLTGSDKVLPESEMEKHIEEFLYSQFSEEPQLTSILMIHTFNKNKEQVKACIDILTKYLTNVVENPNNENFKRIKSSNKVLNDKVLICKGAIEFLQSVGFQKKKILMDGGTEEEFFVLDCEGTNELVEKLKELLVALQEGRPIEMELHRDVRVFSPSHKDTTNFHVPGEFYALSSEEVKREQKLREESVKDMERLMTKEMREREKRGETRKYRFAAIRVKFPDGFVIQATFGTDETFASVRQFISECIELDWIAFDLCTSVGQKIIEDEKTIAQLNLAPASLLQFSFDQNLLKDILRQNIDVETNKFLRSDLLMLALDI